jgi:hypothetical protein
MDNDPCVFCGNVADDVIPITNSCARRHLRHEHFGYPDGRGRWYSYQAED